MKSVTYIPVLLMALAATPLWPQTETTPQQADTTSQADTSNTIPQHPEDRMQAPPPVTGQNYPTAFTSEERANYLRYGVAFTSAYTDNALGGGAAHPISDISYSIAPTIAIDESTSRLHWIATYAPGFTFYQKTSARNETDQNASLEFAYRLSPHVTFSAHDGFQKSSNVFNQPDLGSAATVSGGTQVPNFSVITPIADRLSNAGDVNLTYQFALNEMIGAGGTFTNLHYPNPSQVPGLVDSASQGGSAFYSLRFSGRNYLGVTYQYQRLMSYPTLGQSETQTHAVMAFYTFYPSTHFSMSFFGGPQYADTIEPPVPTGPQVEGKAWNPAAGASFGWQGRLSSLALSYSHVIAGGGGLIGAVHTDDGTVTFRQQIAKRLSGSVSGMYAQNDFIGTLIPGATSGHTVSGTAALQQAIGQHFNVQAGYTRLHQSYSNIPVIATNPDTNREFISISYQFSRPLGR